MKKSLLRIMLLLLGAAAPFMAWAAYTKGGPAYTKRIETALLAEPSSLAAVVTKISFAKQLKVEELKGSWVKVSDGTKSGWVFAGNLAEEKPDETKGLDGLPIAASKTTASAAARPLAPAVADYGARKGDGSATEDLKWMEQTSDAVSVEKDDAYLKEKKKGEFQ